ncbi:PH-like domain-containing protein [Leifsonia sp. 2MCAF36]|uniref:PH-like domain-containing protein n=1 Tax=Leifsonia sp. 2MCAF36 TaxID=3232988 RepID=UPI003F9A14AB
MDKLLPALGILAVVIVVLALAVVGWRRRVQRDSGAGGGYSTPGTLSAPTAEADVLYVATTKAGQHLERLALPGLAFRGAATVSVRPEGVTLAVTGESPVFVPSAVVSGVGAASVAIDRAVERDGLLRLGWTTSGGTAADSYFRVVDPAGRAQLAAAIETIVPRADAPDEAGTSRPNDKEV